MVCDWSPSDNKFPQVSWTLFLDDCNIPVVWMVLIFPPISNSSRFLSRPLKTVPSALITIGITVTLKLSQSSSNIQVFVSLFPCFGFHLVFHWDNKIHCMECPLFFCKLSLDLLFWPGLGDLFGSQNPREFYATHSLRRILICVLPFSCWQLQSRATWRLPFNSHYTKV